ncbi:MAG: histidine ammonia-lyase [Oligoflexus sp.]
MAFRLGEDQLTCQELIWQTQTASSLNLEVQAATWQRLQHFRQIIDQALASDGTHYGINTGFGYLSDVKIDRDKLHHLQLNLIRSHACGVGELMDPDLVRSLLMVRAHTFFLGHTGISEACVKLIMAFLENDILPVIPSQGSVGASGDLAPLAHLALALIGEGEVWFQGQRRPSAEVLTKCGLKAHHLAPKEGLSLINGTHFMTTIAAKAVVEARALLGAADVMLCLSLDAIRGTTKAFDEKIHAVRPHPGQLQVATNVRNLFHETDDILDSHKDCNKVQDPYSFRCGPQVHGAARDTAAFVEQTINRELNSVTDNPLCFSDGSILSGGNFHGEPVAMVMDYLAIAMSEIGNISERRIEKITNPVMSGLPPFVARDSGLSSGFMIPHVVAAALASENKIFCHPASVDSIPTSADKEDHVSMGPIAAIKARRVIRNTAKILAVEALASCQGLDLLKPLVPNKAIKAVYDAIRQISPSMDEDRSLSSDIEKVADWILADGVRTCLRDTGFVLG